MKYGESVFDVLYLILTVTVGVIILIKARNGNEKLMGAAAVILGCGDAFHLVPRVLNYFIDADFTAALGAGKLITSVTMTLFYILVYHIGRSYFGLGKNRTLTAAVYALSALRIALCLFPQNRWLQNESGMTWGIIRNVPFTALGVIVIILYFRNRKTAKRFAPMWILMLLSFAFYIPVAVFAGVVPMLGMLMLPKTVCYVLIVLIFAAAVTKDAPMPKEVV